MKINFKKLSFGKSKLIFFGNPYTDWKIAMAVSLFLGVIIISFSAYIFFGIRKGDLFLVPVKEIVVPKALNQGVLQDILDHFETKAEKFKELQEIGTGISNPD